MMLNHAWIHRVPQMRIASNFFLLFIDNEKFLFMNILNLESITVKLRKDDAIK